MAIWIAELNIDYEGPLEQYVFASESEAQAKALAMLSERGDAEGDTIGMEIYVIGPVNIGEDIREARQQDAKMMRRSKMPSEGVQKKSLKSINEQFDRLMEGVVESEEKKRARKTLDEDSPARRYIKKYGELPQNRIVIKR